MLHVHYAVPHATAAILARAMLPPEQQPRGVTTLLGTNTLLGRDVGYGPAIRHALNCSDAVTAVTAFLRTETQRLLGFDGPLDVIHNFFDPRPPIRSREAVRVELGINDSEVMVVHSSNLRPLKRIDLLLETAARIRPTDSFKLVILAGGNFAHSQIKCAGWDWRGRIIVRDSVTMMEDYLQAADLGLITSDTESFCLSILEAMSFACPSVATRVGGIPEVIDHGVTGLLAPAGDVSALVKAIESLVANPACRNELGNAAGASARNRFSAEVIVPQYEALYRRGCEPATA